MTREMPDYQLRKALWLFEMAHSRVTRAELASKSLYCVCGHPFPNGQVSRVLYGTTQTTSNRCGNCCDYCNRDLTEEAHHPECVKIERRDGR